MTRLIFEKNKKLEYLMNKYDDFKRIIEKYNGNLNLYKCEIDYKVHSLRINECPARYIWHYDGTNNPINDSLVKYELFLCTDNKDAEGRTKFFIQEPKLYEGSEENIHNYANMLEKNGHPIYFIKWNVWNAYTNKNLHSATLSYKKQIRTLIRLRETL